MKCILDDCDQRSKVKYLNTDNKWGMGIWHSEKYFIFITYIWWTSVSTLANFDISGQKFDVL